MRVGVPKEIKTGENRVGLSEAGVRQLVQEGHEVWVQKGAGVGSGISDEAYLKAGAQVVDQAAEVWAQADMIVKVKEPLPAEYEFLRPDLILFTYLHLAADERLARVLLERRVKAVAYETIQNPDGSLPLLIPMSEVAGRLATQVGAFYLQSQQGGKGILLGGAPGVAPARVTIIGGGVVGLAAARMALGLGAMVTIIDLNPRRLEFLDQNLKGRFVTLFSHSHNIEESVIQSDLVIGAVLIPGRKAPKLVTEKMISRMSPGSVVVDVAVDQGGCIETIQPTSHASPTYVYNGVIHYAVPNMPALVARTSTYALTNVTLPYVLSIAQNGLEKAASQDATLRWGINTYGGFATHPAVADDLGLPFREISTFLS